MASNSKEDFEIESQQQEIDKYEKVSLMHDLGKQKEFQTLDLGMMKILNLVVLCLSLINLLFSVATTRFYKLNNFVGYTFPVSMLVLALNSIFG